MTRSSTARSTTRRPASRCGAGRGAIRARAGAVQRPEVTAVRLVPARALGTGAAAAVAEHDVVARPYRGHVRAHGDDDARAFVTEHDRRDRLGPDRLHRQVAVAHADGTQLDQHLVGARLVELDVGDLERRRGADRDSGPDPRSRPDRGGRHGEPLIAVGGDCVAARPVGADAADIGHEDPRLAGDVRAHVPGAGPREERRRRPRRRARPTRPRRRVSARSLVDPVLAQVVDGSRRSTRRAARSRRSCCSARTGSRAGDHEQVREAGDHEAEVGARPAGPLLLQRRRRGRGCRC